MVRMAQVRWRQRIPASAKAPSSRSPLIAVRITSRSAGIIGRSIPGWPINSAAALGETQEGGGASARCFLAAIAHDPGRPGELARASGCGSPTATGRAGSTKRRQGHIRTAMNCFLRAADYYRQAEFHLEPDDPRRLADLRPTWKHARTSSSQYLNPPGEVVEIPYENGKPLCGYFVRAPFPGDKLPVLICMGGLDSIKDEMWFMQAHGCLQRGISVLMIDGPGQGGTLRRHKIVDPRRLRSADRQMHRLAGDARRRRSRRASPSAARQPRRLLRRARRLLRAAPGGGDFAWRDLVDARHVGRARATTSASPMHIKLGVRRRNDEGGAWRRRSRSR